MLAKNLKQYIGKKVYLKVRAFGSDFWLTGPTKREWVIPLRIEKEKVFLRHEIPMPISGQAEYDLPLRSIIEVEEVQP